MEQSSLQTGPVSTDDSNDTAVFSPHKWASYSTRDDEEVKLRIKSAEVLVHTLLSVRDQVHSKQLNRFLSNCIWLISEAEPQHKHRTRYRSIAAQNQIISEGKWDTTDLRHDHVFERNRLVKALLAADEEARTNEEVARKRLAETFVKAAVACTVTKDQHDALNRVAEDVVGWKRYHSANIEIEDTSTGRKGLPNAEGDNNEPFTD